MSEAILYSAEIDNERGTVILLKKEETILPLAYFMCENDIDLKKVLTDTISDFSFLLQTIVEENVQKENPVKTRITATDNGYKIVAKLEPKCKVTWDQGYPYNKYCFTSKGERAVAGCVAIAGAQALTVLRPQMSLITSWDEVVKPFPGLNAQNEIARLISYIGKEVGMNYGVNSSGAATKKISPIFAKYGIKDYDKNRAIDVLDTKHGIIVISGKRAKHGWGPWKKYVDGHAFIADGYIKYNKKDDPYYLHLNYGWGSNSHLKAKDVYLLSAGKKWVEDAKEYYKTIYPHKLFYYTYAYENEINWR